MIDDGVADKGGQRRAVRCAFSRWRGARDAISTFRARIPRTQHLWFRSLFFLITATSHR
jgi:hypothetical protein